MRLISTAASAALITAVALTATAAVPPARPRSPVRSTQASNPVPPLRPAADRTGATTFAGANPAAANITPVARRGTFVWPLSPRPAVLRQFEPPLQEWSSGHRGVDLLADVDQPVLSAGAGVVAFSGVIASRGVITVRHSGGLRTTYEPVDQRVASGTLVDPGTRIGVLAPAPGHCVPRHCLHWGALSGNTYRDPLSLLGFGRPILLPLG